MGARIPGPWALLPVFTSAAHLRYGHRVSSLGQTYDAPAGSYPASFRSEPVTPIRTPSAVARTPLTAMPPGNLSRACWKSVI